MSDSLNFIHGNSFRRCTASVDKRFDYYTLQLITAGGVELFFDDERFELRGPWLWTSPLGPRVRFHAWPQGRSWNHRYIACTGPLAARWHAQRLWPTTPESVAAGHVRNLTARFDAMLGLIARAGPFAHLRAVNLLEGILLERAERRLDATPTPAPWLRDVLDALGDFSRNIDYDALARRCGMSINTFRRRFLAATGRSPHTHRLDLRIHAARRLLSETDLPIKRIADDLGYRDVFYFSRQFARHAGVAPGAYRRSRLG